EPDQEEPLRARSYIEVPARCRASLHPATPIPEEAHHPPQSLYLVAEPQTTSVGRASPGRVLLERHISPHATGILRELKDWVCLPVRARAIAGIAGDALWQHE